MIVGKKVEARWGEGKSRGNPQYRSIFIQELNTNTTLFYF